MERRKKTPNASEHDCSAGSGGYIKVQGTRKLDCPARLQVRAIRLYIDYILALAEILPNKGLRKTKAAILKQFENDRQMGKQLSRLRGTI